ncbi:hypothetical protein CEXT_257071 [Caerostris extrusa]|uniref:Uncharacterized protein n=1 Tax=Caerostris extrusa TaxID=172846 RepID=A0AAV4W3V7_CAEEX|nr:hypothetical protein CEXT_257071 [Caerostris extrusa]
MFERSSPGTGTKSGNPAPRLTGPLASRGPVSGRQDPDAMSFSLPHLLYRECSICNHPPLGIHLMQNGRSACFRQLCLTP